MYFDSITETTEGSYIGYTIRDPEFFYEVGIKVLEYKQRSIGVLPCAKTMQNSYIHLSYNVGGYKTLAEYMMTAGYNIWDEILYKIFGIISQIRENGFLKVENLEISADKIFVNIYDNSVKMICLPLYKLTKSANYDELWKKMIYIVRQHTENLSTEDRNQLIKIVNRYFDKDENSELIDERYIIPGVINSENEPSYEASNTNPVFEVEEFQKSNKGFLQNLFKKKDNETETVKTMRKNVSNKLFLRALNSEKDIEVNKNNFYIGNDTMGTDMTFHDNNKISEMHCKLLVDGKRMYIIDYGSQYGTYINDVRIEPNSLVEFYKKDIITIADMKFEVE